MGRKILRAILFVVAGLGAAFIALIAFLVYPGRPAQSDALRFDGFVLLPRHGFFSVLDYLTLDGRTLYVSGTSSGSVFSLPLDDKGTPGPLREWRGEPRVH